VLRVAAKPRMSHWQMRRCSRSCHSVRRIRRAHSDEMRRMPARASSILMRLLLSTSEHVLAQRPIVAARSDAARLLLIFYVRFSPVVALLVRENSNPSPRLRRPENLRTWHRTSRVATQGRFRSVWPPSKGGMTSGQGVPAGDPRVWKSRKVVEA
jgi:hypothetical protein